METRDGEFVGDCGLTWQDVNGTPELEVGYHVRTALQGRGLASEAAAACRDLARDDIGAETLVAILHPDNTASERVARRIGMQRVAEDLGTLPVRTVMSMRLR